MKKWNVKGIWKKAQKTAVKWTNNSTTAVYTGVVVGVLLLAACLSSSHTSDQEVLDNVVQLTDADGSSCSGIRIRHPDTGKSYIISAAHCMGLAYALPDMNPALLDMLKAPTLVIKVSSLDGNTTEFAKVIKTDISFDLMLLESATNTGITVGSKGVHEGEAVHTITHGAGMPKYRTEGEVIKPQIPFTNPFFFVKTLTTAKILPGSSGGALLNSDNELVGIATHGDGTDFFSYFASWEQIRVFLTLAN